MKAIEAKVISENSDVPFSEALKRIKTEAEKGGNKIEIKILNEKSITDLKQLGYSVHRNLNASKGHTIYW